MGQKDMVRHLARSMEAVMRFVPSDGAPTATYLGPAPAAGSVSPAAVTVPPSLKYLSFAIGPELLPGAGADPLAGAHLTKALYGKLVREAAAGAPWAALTLELQSQPAAPDGRGVFIRLDPCRPTHPHALAELSKAVARITPLLLVAYSSGSQGGASGAVDSTASPAGAGSAPAGATAASTGPIEGAPAAGARFDAKGCFLRACREHTCLDVFTPGDQHRMNPLYLGAVRYIPPILGDQSSPSVAALAKEIDALNAQLFERMSTADASRSFLLSRLPSADGQVFITCGPPHPTPVPPMNPEAPIPLSDPNDLGAFRTAGQIAGDCLILAEMLAQPGVTTDTLDHAIHEYIIGHDAYPSCLGYRGFPKAICTSINNVIAHGIPDARPLEEGDILNVDVTVHRGGVHADCSAMFAIGQVDDLGRALCQAALEARDEGIRVAGPGVPLSEMCRAAWCASRQGG
ncbi:hypothetical protein H696_01472 [Fonticula alba]|uniref:Peptidase M24 domain-containing protein n=1 Tax=Fonticula alba TaxID=691883 RepID=A0A058ZCF6_FONAL|nr:hypothetical protein H696_01472 [Fonticula alba]KCV72064.1 hypothetical protein H696_01472 [Fonticula alba]|eukprot:XP_009493642.1 hypothetical protein H696_01472 [Fonticula alba]